MQETRLGSTPSDLTQNRIHAIHICSCESTCITVSWITTETSKDEQAAAQRGLVKHHYTQLNVCCYFCGELFWNSGEVVLKKGKRWSWNSSVKKNANQYVTHKYEWIRHVMNMNVHVYHHVSSHTRLNESCLKYEWMCHVMDEFIISQITMINCLTIYVWSLSKDTYECVHT